MNNPWLPMMCSALLLSLTACSADPDSGEALATDSEALGTAFMNTGEYLFPGQTIWSSDCGYQLVMETSGNLSVRNRNGVLQWYSHTAPSTGAYMAFQTDGNVVVRNLGGSALWHIGTHPGASRLRIQSDANVVMTNSGGGLLWHLNLVKPGMGGSCFQAPKITVDTTVWANTDLSGTQSDFLVDGALNPADCGGKCAANSRCMAWNWRPVPGSGSGLCHLKDAVPGSQNMQGVVSGRINKICQGCITP